MRGIKVISFLPPQNNAFLISKQNVIIFGTTFPSYNDLITYHIFTFNEKVQEENHYSLLLANAYAYIA